MPLTPWQGAAEHVMMPPPPPKTSLTVSNVAGTALPASAAPAVETLPPRPAALRPAEPLALTPAELFRPADELLALMPAEPSPPVGVLPADAGACTSSDSQPVSSDTMESTNDRQNIESRSFIEHDHAMRTRYELSPRRFKRECFGLLFRLDVTLLFFPPAFRIAACSNC